MYGRPLIGGKEIVWMPHNCPFLFLRTTRGFARISTGERLKRLLESSRF